MTPTYVVFQTLYDQIQTPFIAGVTGLVASLSNYARQPVQVALVIYIAISGMVLAMGKGGSAGDTVTHLLKVAIVAWFATDATAYSTWVQQFFMTDLPNDLASAVVTGNGGAAGTTAWAFDMIWRHSWEAGWSVWKTLSVADLGEEIVVVLFWIAALLSVGIAFAIWMMSQIILALYIIIGPLVIVMVLFAPTRAITARWIGGILSSIFLQVGILILLTLTLRTEAGLVTQIPSTVGPNVYVGLNLLLACIAVFLLCGILAFQMPGWAASLAGGMQFHGGALALIMLTQMRGATSAISRTGGALNEGTDAVRRRLGAEAPGRTMSFATANSEPWMNSTGGYAGLSPTHQASATRSYQRWSAANPGLGARHPLGDYVAYVQRKTAERNAP